MKTDSLRLICRTSCWKRGRERENEMVYLYTHRNPINICFMCWIEWVGRCHVMNRIGMKIPAHSNFCAFQFGSQTIWHFGWINPTHWFMETAWRSRDCCQIRFHDPKSTLVRDGNNGCVLFDIQPYTVRRMSDYTKPIFMYFPSLELSFFLFYEMRNESYFPFSSSSSSKKWPIQEQTWNDFKYSRQTCFAISGEISQIKRWNFCWLFIVLTKNKYGTMEFPTVWMRMSFETEFFPYNYIEFLITVIFSSDIYWNDMPFGMISL